MIDALRLRLRRIGAALRQHWHEYLVAAVSLVVLYGHRIGSEALASVFEGQVTMKVATALCFFAGAVGMIRPAWRRRSAGAIAVLVALSLLEGYGVLPPMVTALGIGSEALSATPGLMSLGTAALFLVRAVHLWSGTPRVVRTAQPLYITVGIVAVWGYLLDVPAMTYYVAGISTAMAFHTAVLFALWGRVPRAEPKAGPEA